MQNSKDSTGSTIAYITSWSDNSCLPTRKKSIISVSSYPSISGVDVNNDSLLTDYIYAKTYRKTQTTCVKTVTYRRRDNNQPMNFKPICHHLQLAARPR